MHGNQEISDPTIRAYVDEQTNLMSFRMFSGVRAATLVEAKQLIRWAEINRVDLRKVAACGDYFDIELRQVRKHQLPGRSYLALMKISSSFFLVGVLVCVWLLLIPQVPFTLKETQRTFIATETSAQPLWPPLFLSRQPLRKNDCKQLVAGDVSRASFTEDEVTVVCKLLLAEGWSGYLKAELKEQRWYRLAFALFLTMLFFQSVGALRRVKIAKEFSALNISPAIPQDNLNLF